MGYNCHFVAIHSNVNDMNSAPQASLRIDVGRAPVQISAPIDCRMRRVRVDRLSGFDHTVGRPDN
jgi:hypothetical protein